MKYVVTVSDEVTYTINADSEYEAKEQADIWFCERRHNITCKTVPEYAVEVAPLHEVIESWVETFNDCACCPCMDCPRERFGEDTSWCANRIIADILQAQEVE